MSDRMAELKTLRSKAADLRRELDGIERRITVLDPSAKPRRLTDKYIRNVQRPGMHCDNENGLMLRVVRSAKHGTVSKQWVQRLQINGKRTDRGLGGYPVVSLREARELAFQNKVTARAAKTIGSRAIAPKAPSFAESADAVLRLKAAGWKGGLAGARAEQWRQTVRDYVIPTMGTLSVAEITAQHVRKALEPIWLTKHATAASLRSRIAAVMDWAIASGHRADNPAGKAILNTLPRINGNVRTEHREALHHSDVADAILTFRDSKSGDSLKQLFEFLVLTAVRETEALGTRWNEIDLESKTWTVPAERTKKEREHRVPLSDRAIAILLEARGASASSEIAFVSRTGGPFRRGTIVKALRDRGIKSTTHGFRSSFRDWAAECTDSPREVAEACLAHVTGNSTERAYFRSDLLEKRRNLMQAWANYLAE